ncbi:MAG: T9SS type A sorting domain-containing protein [Bacteroidetes bacterium]|nr:T9SS type A sorting domain-containing protein [Bacteroidota bacterium]
MKKLLVAMVLVIPVTVWAQPAGRMVVEHTWVHDGNGNLICQENHRHESFMKIQADEAVTSQLRFVEESFGSKSGGLDIILRATAQLDQFPDAKTAFVNAAEALEAIILTPAVVVIDVDYGPTRFGSAWSSSLVIGSTSSAISLATSGINGGGSAVSSIQFADSLYSRNPGFADLYFSIPNPIEAETGTVEEIYGTRPNLQALGFYSLQTSPNITYGQTPNIGFNSAFTFDLNPSDGITAGKTDFQGVAIHEIGHALGFVSSVGWGSAAWIAIWDIFRFRPGAVKNYEDFNAQPRVTTAGPSTVGGDHVFWEGLAEYALSTSNGNGTGGDGRQASHWMDDDLRGAVPASERKIGIMDPTVGAGEKLFISVADKRMLAVIGWDVEFGFVANPVTEASVYSDYTTPTSAVVSFITPSSLYNGKELSDWSMIVERNGTKIYENASAGPAQLTTLTDEGLITGTSYTYRFYSLHESGDTGIVISKVRVAGGSLVPSGVETLSNLNNSSAVALEFAIPTKHDDGTPLHNLRGYQVVRSPGGITVEGTLSSTDTGKTIQVIDIPPGKTARNYRYDIRILGEGSEAYASGASLVVRLGSTLATYSENMDGSSKKVIPAGGWGYSSTALSGESSLGITNLNGTVNSSAYLPYLRLSSGNSVSFQTICRITGSRGSGVVELSDDWGKTWKTQLTLTSDSYTEWASGQNVWKKQTLDLRSWANDTVLVRFRADYNSADTDFGWLIDDVELGVFTSVEGEGQQPSRLTLDQNYPNPFNPETLIRFTLPVTGQVQLTVSDILGRTLATLISETMPAGTHNAGFNAASLPSGVYFYQLRFNGQTLTRKMTVVK